MQHEVIQKKTASFKQLPHFVPFLFSSFLELQQVSKDLSSTSVCRWFPGQGHRLLGEVNGLKVDWWTGFHCGGWESSLW